MQTAQIPPPIPPLLQYERPAIINGYHKQKEFIDCAERYAVIEATTKAGKTTGCIVWLFEQALMAKPNSHCWWVAPIFSQSEIAYKRLKRFITHPNLFRTNETKLTITCPNNVTIAFKSSDNPDSLYGEDVVAAVLDEATRMHVDAWYAVRSTLTATQGKCKIIGNVKGTNNWAYEMARKAEAKAIPDWQYFKITCDDAVAAGIMKADEVEDARRTLPNGVFLELYYGIPNQNSSAKFCFAFDEKKHVDKCPPVDAQYPLYLSFDFNKNPICCSVIQHYDGRIYVLETIKLQNSSIMKLCEFIKNKYDGFMLIVTGDASGQSGSALVEDKINYYTKIITELNLARSQVRVPLTNPALEDNQVLVNALLEHYPITIDTDKAQSLIFDMKFVEMLPDGKIKKGDREDPKQQADALDTFRYWCNTFMGHFLKAR